MNNRYRQLCLAAVMSSLAWVTAGCSTTSPDVIKPEDAQRLSQVQDAVVLNVRVVAVEGSQSGVGGATGAIVGAIGGNASVGGNGRGSAAAGVLGAVVGGVVGNAVERFGTREEAYEILLQMASGERKAIVQAKGTEVFNPGDAVILVVTGGKTRVMLAPKVVTPPAK